MRVIWYIVLTCQPTCLLTNPAAAEIAELDKQGGKVEGKDNGDENGSTSPDDDDHRSRAGSEVSTPASVDSAMVSNGHHHVKIADEK